jgi:hypothetical protein
LPIFELGGDNLTIDVMPFRDYGGGGGVNESGMSWGVGGGGFGGEGVGIPQKLEIDFFWPVGPLWVGQDASGTLQSDETVRVQVFRVFVKVVRVESIVYVIQLVPLSLMLIPRSGF